jgi:hypothetical protein
MQKTLRDITRGAYVIIGGITVAAVAAIAAIVWLVS